MNAVTSVSPNAASISFQAQSGGDLEMTSLASVSNLGSIFGNFNVTGDASTSNTDLFTGVVTAAGTLTSIKVAGSVTGFGAGPSPGCGNG